MFIVLSLFTLYLFAVGYASASFLKVPGRLFEQVALTIGAGMLINFCLVLTGLRLSLVFTAGATLALCGAWRLWRDVRTWREGGAREYKITVFSVAGAVAPLVIYCLYYFQILSEPLRYWDARSIWFFHAKMIWAEGALRQHAGWNHPSLAFSNPDYPKLVPAIAAQLAYLRGYWNEFLPKGSLLMMLIPVLLWVFSFRKAGVSFFLLVLTFFLSLGYWLWNAYMDWYLAMYAGVALLTLGRFLSEGRAVDLYSGVCAAGIAASIKYEGLLFSACLVATVVLVGPAYGDNVVTLAKRIRSDASFATVLLLSVAPTLMWAVCKRAWGLQSAVLRDPSAGWVRLLNRISDGATPQYVLDTLIVRGTAIGMVTGLVVAVGIFSIYQKRTLPRGALVAGATAVLYMCGLYVVYLGTPADVGWLLYTSVYRTTLTACMALAVSMFFLLSSLETSGVSTRNYHRAAPVSRPEEPRSIVGSTGHGSA